MEETIRRQLAQNLKRHRTEAQISQSELARMCGLHRSYVGKIERASKTPSLDTIVRLSRALLIPPSALLDRLGEPTEAERSQPSAQPPPRGRTARELGSLVVDDAGRIRAVDEELLERVSLDPEEVLAHPLWKTPLGRLTPGSCQQLEEHFAMARTEGTARLRVETREPEAPLNRALFQVRSLHEDNGESRLRVEVSLPDATEAPSGSKTTTPS